MNDDDQTPPGLSREEIDKLMDPLLSAAERQTAWRKKPLSVQARKVQDNWKPAFKGPLHLGLGSCALAVVALLLIIFSDTWRMAGVTVFALWYPTLLLAAYQMHQLSKLRVNEI